LIGFAAQIRRSSLIGSCALETAEHREIERFTHGSGSARGRDSSGRLDRLYGPAARCKPKVMI
jgi:hypothetical protein